MPLDERLTSLPWPGVGLGCSRLGSVLTGGEDEALAVLAAASRGGISVFDTADIYGQGDSERLLGQHLSRTGAKAFVVTKVGQVYPGSISALSKLKRVARKLAASSPMVTRTVSNLRAKPLRRDFSAGHLRAAAVASASRLGRRPDVLLLHGPSVQVIRSGDAIGVIDELRSTGAVRAIGVSCDTVDCARAAIADRRVQAIQIPLSAGDATFAGVAAEAKARGVLVIAREVLGGVRPISSRPMSHADAIAAVSAVAGNPHVDVTLVGTTNAERLTALLAGLRSARPRATGT